MSRFTFEGPSGYLTIRAPPDLCDAMDAWRTSFPRLSIWEDALSAGLVRLGHGSFRERQVTITGRGQFLLRGRSATGIAAEKTSHARRDGPSQ
jgi:hypothetical protein